MNLLIKEIAQKKSEDYRRRPCGHKKGAAVNNPQKLRTMELKTKIAARSRCHLGKPPLLPHRCNPRQVFHGWHQTFF